jgi:hypothetical protein
MWNCNHCLSPPELYDAVILKSPDSQLGCCPKCNASPGHILGTHIQSLMKDNHGFVIICQCYPWIILVGNHAAGRLTAVQLPPGAQTRNGLVRALYDVFPDKSIVTSSGTQHSVRPLVCMTGVHNARRQFVVVGTCNSWLLHCALPAPSDVSQIVDQRRIIRAKMTNRCNSDLLGFQILPGGECWFMDP